jgi:uncharacterized protein
VHPDVSVLLEVQRDDVEIFSLEAKLAALAPRLEALAVDARRAETAVAAARAAVEAEEKRQHDLQFRITQHRELVKRNETVLNAVTSPREAAAANAQVEQARRMLADDEREINAINARLTEYRTAVKDREAALVAARETQATASVTLVAEKATVLAELKALRATRDGKAATVSRLQMTRYDRIQKRERSVALFALRGQSCSNCDTMLPMQRCNAMAVTGVPEVCEGCGVLLYAAD